MHVLTEYHKHDHLLSNVDARVKLLAALAVLTMVLTCKGLAFPAFVALSCLYLCFRMKVPARLLLLRFSEPLFIAGMVLVLKMLFSGTDVLFSLDVLSVHIIGHRDGLHAGLVIGNRIMSAVSIVAVLGFSTPFTEFMSGLSWFRMPKGFIEIMMFAYRYIFVLFEDAQVIYQAQKNRLGYATLRRGLSSFGTLAGSLTIRAFDHSQNTTVAMVQRGYDGSIPMHGHKPFKFSQIAASVLLLLALGVIWRM